MQHKSPINPDTLKVGDVISKWARYSSRTTLGNGVDHFEVRRHLIIEVGHSHVSTVVLLWKHNPADAEAMSNSAINPGSIYNIPTRTIRGVLNWRMSE